MGRITPRRSLRCRSLYCRRKGGEEAVSEHHSGRAGGTGGGAITTAPFEASVPYRAFSSCAWMTYVDTRSPRDRSCIRTRWIVCVPVGKSMESAVQMPCGSSASG
eukprot:7385831-Prymnesium_polylepis.7